MAAFYADENVPSELVARLRGLGHEVLTVQQDGQAGLGVGDPDVLRLATELGRAVLTNNRDDFHRLHRLTPNHAGIVTHTADTDRVALALRVHLAVAEHPSLDGVLLRVIRPA